MTDTTTKRHSGKHSMNKTLIVPILLGWVALALAFVAGLAFDNLLPAIFSLTLNAIIIVFVVKMASDLGAIKVYDDEMRR